MNAVEPQPVAVVPEDEAGFAALIQRQQRLVYGMARRALGRHQDAQDLAQEVFLTLYQHRGAIQSEAHLVFWLRQVTARKCVDQRRRHWFHFDELPELPVAAAVPDPWMDQKLQEAVERLPMRARLVVILRYQQDLEPAEIAPILNLPLATVKSHLRRSLTRLRRHLEEYHER